MSGSRIVSNRAGSKGGGLRVHEDFSRCGCVVELQRAWFLMGGSWGPVLWLRGDSPLGSACQDSGYRSLQTQARDRVRD